MHQRRRLFMFWGSAGLFLIGSFVPAWKVWHVQYMGATASYQNLWTAIATIPRNAKQVGWFSASVGLNTGAIGAAAGLLVFGGILGMRLQYFLAKHRPRKKQGVCRVCGYDMRATPARCPECGRAVKNASLKAGP